VTHTSPHTISSGSASFIFSWTAPNAAGVYYIQAAGNAVNSNGTNDAGDLWNWLNASNYAITVAGVDVTSPNGSENWCAGSTHNITWTSFGITNVKIEVSSNGGSSYTTLTASTAASTGSYSWSIPSSQTAGTQYLVRITDASTSSRTDASDAAFSIITGPSISSHPQSQTVCAGTSTSFSVSATGTGITYQWRRNSSNITNATTSTLTIASPAAGDAGTYDVVVTNPCGSVTSNSATFVVNTPPAITSQPQSQSICVGQPVTFSVVATGTGISYQWLKNGVNISGATGTSYQIASVAAGDAGSYTVTITGTCQPSATSSAATLTVRTPPAITTQPTAQTTCTGQSATFTVVATGTSLTYQWRKGGSAITGATNASYSINNATTGDAGSYDVVVSGACSPSVTSNAVALTVNQSPEITTQPTNQTVCVGQPVTFMVEATGQGLTYQWHKDGVDIAGATSASYSIPSVALSDAAGYDVIVNTTSGCASVTSNTAALNVNAAPTITVQPTDKSGVVGSKIVLSVSASGNNLNYQWRKGGTAITGANAATFTLNNLQQSDAGSYDVLVGNSCGNVTSSTAHVTVLAAGAGAVLTLSPSTVDLGASKVGTPKDVSFTSLVTNSGDSALHVTAMTFGGTNAGEFAVVGATAFDLAPGASQTVTIRFTPGGAGDRAATLSFASNAKTNPTLNLTGKGVTAGSLSSLATTYNLGKVDVGSTLDTTIKVCNNGLIPVTIASVGLSGPNASAFALVPGQSLPVTLKPSDCIDIKVRFNPTAAGPITATLTIHSDAGPADLALTLNATVQPTGAVPDLAERAVQSLRIFPNPLKDATTIVVHVAKPAKLQVQIVDERGVVVRSFGERQVTSEYTTVWDGRNQEGTLCPSGQYHVTVRSGDPSTDAHEVTTASVILVR
jgi:hypothetical protein